MRRSNSDTSQGKGRGRGGRRDGRGRGYSNVKPEKRDDSGDGTVYLATVTELALDAPAQGVFATLKASRGRYPGQRCLQELFVGIFFLFSSNISVLARPIASELSSLYT